MLDEKGRKKRATKAANVLAEIRRKKVKDRDKLIVLAFDWLSNNPQLKPEMKKAIAFLNEKCGSPNLKQDQTVLRKLADATGLTRERVRQIVKKAKK